MSQIKIKVLKQGTPSTKVLSFAFFTMKSAYRSFNKYEHQLKLSVHASRVLKGFETRIYTDDTGAEAALEIASKYSDVSVYHFDCPPFREGEGHTGTFGTLVRFLPMFEEGLETVWISDIDVNYQKDWFSNSLLKVVQDYDVFAENRICYERRPWNANKKFPFVAYRMIFNVVFPKRMLTHYINKLLDGSYAKVISDINDYNVRKPRNDKFPYGMDEYFTNVVLYDYIKRKDMKCLFRKDYELTGWLTHEESGLTKREQDLVYKYNDGPKTKEALEKIRPIYRKGIKLFQELDPTRFKCFDEVSHLLDKFKTEMVMWFAVTGKDL
jgi:hypothetical protein